MLVFNTGILAAAAAVASRPGRSASLVFGLGVVACVVSYFVMRTQHEYYRAARDRMRRVEESVGIPNDQRLDTTATLGDRKRGGLSVTQLVYLLTAAVGVADVVGGIIIAVR